MTDEQKQAFKERMIAGRLAKQMAKQSEGSGVIKVKKVRSSAKLPTYATDGSACFDFYAAEKAVISPGCTVLVGTGLAMEIPEGYCLELYPRSGISAKTYLRMAHSVGIIDSDYRGEIMLPVWNSYQAARHMLDDQCEVYSVTGAKYHDTAISSPKVFTYVVQQGERIAQGKLVKVEKVDFQEIDELSETERGAGGFNSSGVT